MVALQKLKAFARDCSANAVMIFALAAIPIFGIAGFAIDMNRQHTYQKKVQSGLDFAVVATARYALKNPSADDGQLKIVAQDFFDAEIANAPEINLGKIDFKRNGDLVTLDVTGDMPTSIMQIMGTQKMPLGTQAAAVFGEPSSAEIALVLDTSASMAGSKLTTLRVAANDMVDTLVKANNSAVKMSIVPFATYVNVGTSKKGESWLQVQPDETSSKTQCSIPNSWYKKNCKRESYSCTRDGVKKTCKRWKCDPAKKKNAPKTCKKKTTKKNWYGCVKSRPDPYNIKDSNYASQKVVGFVTTGSWACPTEIQELTNVPGQLKATTAKLKASQNTYIATGLTWGYRTLTASAPFSEGTASAAMKAKNGRKALVLMSDGENTKAPNNNGYHNNGSKTKANEITEKVCEEIKSNDIELYTIAFEITDTATKELLKRCATSADYYYDAKNSADLKAAFAQISDEFRDIALAK
ncbi:MAG: pilus assembly protein TadG-related protein [Pseudomonadota bacterium]